MSVNLIRIYSEEEFKKIEKMSGRDYRIFLEELLVRAKNNPKLKKYNFVAKNKLYEFFEYPPTLRNDDGKVIEIYTEDKFQRKERLELKKYYKKICEPYISQNGENLVVNKKVNYKTVYIDDEEGNNVPVIAIREVLELLNINSSTFSNIQFIEGKENLRSFILSGKKYVSEEDLMKYLNKKHYEPSDIDFVKMYKEVKKLKGCSNKETVAKEKLKEIINSKEYKEKWNEYLQKIVEEQRVYRIFNKQKVDGIEVFYKNSDEDYFDIYNPNIKVCNKKINEIPKLYNLNYWAAFLGIELRSVNRYCELGTLKFYRIGSKYMISAEDFAECKSNLKKNKRKGRENSGRKRKIDIVLNDEDLLKDGFSQYVSTNFKKLLDDKKNIEKELEITEDKKVIRKMNASLIHVDNDIMKIRREIITKILDDKMELIKEDIDEYNKELKIITTYKNDRNKAEKDNKVNFMMQLDAIIKEKQNYLNEKKNIIMKKICEN